MAYSSHISRLMCNVCQQDNRYKKNDFSLVLVAMLAVMRAPYSDLMFSPQCCDRLLIGYSYRRNNLSKYFTEANAKITRKVMLNIWREVWSFILIDGTLVVKSLCCVCWRAIWVKYWCIVYAKRSMAIWCCVFTEYGWVIYNCEALYIR